MDGGGDGCPGWATEYALGAGAQPAVHDEAGFFDQATIEQANKQITDIKDKTKKDLMVETFAALPENLRADYDPDNKQKTFDQWANARAHELDLNGIYVLICKDPSYLLVEVGKHTREKAFTAHNRDALRDILLKSFKDKKFNEGLLSGIAYVQETLQTNIRQTATQGLQASGHDHGQIARTGAGNVPAQTTQYPPAQPQPEPQRKGVSWFTIAIVILVIILVARLVSRMFSRGQGYGGQGYGPGGGVGGYGGGNQSYGYGGGGYGGGGGGGFMRGLFGGLLGGAAGSYMYDKFRDHGNEAQAQPPADSGSNYVDNSSSSGGDFGSSSSGGDFGSSSSSDFSSGDSGSSSGGDFGGGGDSGGGGGDSGGSGGDF